MCPVAMLTHFSSAGELVDVVPGTEGVLPELKGLSGFVLFDMFKFPYFVLLISEIS